MTIGSSKSTETARKWPLRLVERCRAMFGTMHDLEPQELRLLDFDDMPSAPLPPEPIADAVLEAEPELGVKSRAQAPQGVAGSTAQVPSPQFPKRLEFRGTPDEYFVRLGVAGVNKQDISILVMRTHAIVNVVVRNKPVQGGNVFYIGKAAEGVNRRCQLKFAYPITPNGHRASLTNGVLTLRFMKEKQLPVWSHPLVVT